MNCPICGEDGQLSLCKEGCDYYHCPSCEFLFHRRHSSGPKQPSLSAYDSDYWEMERAEACRREQDDAFLRALELVFISTVPVKNILDFGCGAAGTVRLLREILGLNAVGVDPFGEFEPSPFLHRTDLGGLRDIYPAGFFDAIYSIEVFEHLEDPKGVLQDLAYFLRPGGRILINTGTREFIAENDPEQTYIDPSRRGHISIYSLKSLARLAAGAGMTARFMGRRRYVVLLEPADGGAKPYPDPESVATLERGRGEWFPSLLAEYMRLVHLEEEFDARGRWALGLDREVNDLRREVAARDEQIAAMQEERRWRRRFSPVYWLGRIARAVHPKPGP